MAKKDDTVSRFELDGEIVEIDVAELTFGEIEFVETYFDRSANMVDWESGRATLLIAALARARKQKIPIAVAMEDLRDVQISTIKKAPKPKRPTKSKAPASGGTPD